MQYGSIKSTELSPSNRRECCDNRLRRSRFTLPQMVAVALTCAVAPALVVYGGWGLGGSHLQQVLNPATALFRERPDARLGGAVQLR